MIRRAVTEDLPRLKQLWADCFGDSTEYIDFYFQNRFHEVETYVYEKDEWIVSMLTLISAHAVSGLESRKAKYIYAVATDPCFQKQGIAKKMLTFICHKSVEEKIELFLVPATESLFDYYQKCGFVTTADQTIIQIDPLQIRNKYDDRKQLNPECCIRPLTSQIWDRARDASFTKNGYVRWDLNGLTYLLKEWVFCGGLAWEVSSGSTIGAILFRIDLSNGYLFIKEAAMPKELFDWVLLKIVEEYKIQKIEYISATHRENAKKRPFTMSYKNDEMSTLGYVNFVKD